MNPLYKIATLLCVLASMVSTANANHFEDIEIKSYGRQRAIVGKIFIYDDNAKFEFNADWPDQNFFEVILQKFGFPIQRSIYFSEESGNNLIKNRCKKEGAKNSKTTISAIVSQSTISKDGSEPKISSRIYMKSFKIIDKGQRCIF